MLKKAIIITLGCAKNSVDSEHLAGSLLDKGIDIVEQPEDADYIIINTCGFIEAAKQESINTILEAAALKNDGNPKKIIVTGCLAQRYLDELSTEMPEIDALVGIAGEWDIAEMVVNDSFAAHSPSSPIRDFAAYPARRLAGSPSAYLQIADGCDNWCAYCAIPLIRGRFRSKTLQMILDEARVLDASAVTEINLIAQDTGRYGYDLYGRLRLYDLIASLKSFTNIRWIRLLYLQPQNINDDLVNAIKENALVVPYLDIPFQHASPAILRAMNRLGAGSDFLAQIAWVRRALSDVVLRSSVIVGFPGETEDDFAELIDFVEKAELDHLGIFEYSQEEGTAAAHLDSQLPENIIKERYHQLTALQDSISQRRSEERIGKTFDVLVEHVVEPGYFEGRGYWQAPDIDGVTYITDERARHDAPIMDRPMIGDIVKVRLDEFDGCDYHGGLIGGPGK